jgi:hypothetical protein
MTDAAAAKPLTPFRLRALAILRDVTDRSSFSRMTGRSMAKALWPNSPAWEKRTRRRGGGNQSGAVGGTMPMKGAKVLWDFQTEGLAFQEIDREWTISERGRQALAAAGL